MSGSELVNVADFEKVFLGGCKGVGLFKRGPNDPHVVFTILTEDDDNWFASGSGGSSFWLPDLIEQLNAAQAWLEANADPDPQGYGYVLKEKP